MSAAGWVQFVIFGVLIAISTPLLGVYMYRVYFTKKAPGDRVFLPVERFIYRLIGMVAVRRKLEPDPANPRYFITEPGSGIRFVPEGATGG